MWLRAERPGGRTTHTLLRAATPRPTPKPPPPPPSGSVASGPKEVVIVLDTYGPDLYSENDYNLADAKVAAGWALNTLTDSDFFSIVTYDKRGTTLWRRELIRATPPNLAAAKRWLERVEAGYGARLDRAVSDAMELFSGAGPSG